MTSLLLSANWKKNNYDLILVIINCLTIMIYFKLVKVIINTPGLAKVIINLVVQYYDLPNFIISDCGAIFMSKFWYLLCYFLSINKQLFTAFHSQTNGQKKQLNSTIKAYFCVFVN